MRRCKYLLAAAFAAMFAACSDDNGLDEKVAGPYWNEDGTGYVSLSINLPTQPSTRAVNDNFDDGLPGEYNVNDATLVLFEGTGAAEANATFNSAYNLSTAEWKNENDDPNQITTYAQITQKINSISANNIFALVILNRGEVFEVGENNTLKIIGENENIPKSLTFTKFLAKISEKSFIKNTNILMLNSPFCNVPGGNSNPSDGNLTTLVELKKDNIFPTREEAEHAPAGSIYVERAVAKTTVKSTSAATGSIENTKIAYKIDGWKLTNTNTKSYIVRNVKTDYLAYFSAGVNNSNNKYRFVGSNPVEPNVPLYRYYWATDPNFEVDATSELIQLDTVTSIKWNELGDEHPEYCKENTFDVSRQKHQNTTAVVVKATLNNGELFYTINDANILYTLEGATNFLKNLYISNNDVDVWFKANHRALKEGETTIEFTAKDFNLITETDENMQVTLTGVELTEAGKAKMKEGYAEMPLSEALLKYINETVVKKFEGGVAYYTVLVKHFGDDLTPWNTWEKDAGSAIPTPGSIYPGADASNNYLGRYGMVRNNWYDIDVDGIKKIGSPVVPSLKDDSNPDDELDSYISVKINILSWAKRTQGVTL